jgi:hypothetical protein
MSNPDTIRRVREALRLSVAWTAGLVRGRPAFRPIGAAGAFMDELFALFPFTAEAQRWFRSGVRVVLLDPNSTRGGGLWYPLLNQVTLFTAQYEAAIHELAHAWWEARRDAVGLIAAVVRASENRDPRYGRITGLARDYVHGTADGFPGFLRTRNDTEMYAGLASGAMADLRLMPPDLRRFYRTFLCELPPGAPAPVQGARHG